MGVPEVQAKNAVKRIEIWSNNGSDELRPAQQAEVGL